MTGGHALVLAGHGSHRNPGSAAPVLAHADRIRSRGVFAEVRAGFWKEEPELREVLRTVTSETVFVVPVMMSEGYFVDRVFPRELGVTEQANTVTTKSVHYTRPVGTHASMTDVVINRAKAVTGNPRIGPGVELLLVGHGTERNPQSAATTYRHSARVRARDRFDDVTALFMDEEPAITDWEIYVASDGVVVVPFFVADGYHTQEDIPAALGLTPNSTGTYPVPGTVDGRRIWYTSAVGTHPGLADVIVDRAREAGAAPRSPRPPEHSPGLTDQEIAFLSWIAQGDHERRVWGELLLTQQEAEQYAVRHQADQGRSQNRLETLTSPSAVRDLTRYDDTGEYRPLRGAPTLPTGWIAPELSSKELVSVVDFVYPTSITDWAEANEGGLQTLSFQETARRQTGKYAGLEDIPPIDLASTITACCDGCVKRREWDADGEPPAEDSSPTDEIPCREPCSFFIAAATEFRGIDPAEESHDIDQSIRPGDVGTAGNEYRARYRKAKRTVGKQAAVRGGRE